MGRLAQTEGLTEAERDILATVREFTDREIIPVASELDHADEYPAEIVAGMKRLGLFGLRIPEAYAGLGVSLLLYALVAEELARGWISVAGIINTHFIVAHMIARHGTAEQRDYFLPAMAAGEIRGAFSMSEPDLGSDVAAIKTRAVRDGDDFVLNGQKMWVTSGATANLVAVLCRTDDGRDRPHQNLTTFLIEKEPGFGPNPAVPGLVVPGKIAKMGYRGVDTTEMILTDVRVPASRVLGGQTGQGFYHMMDGIEVGRVNTAARGCGMALRAFELAIDYAQRRQHVRPADRPAPGDHVQAGRDGHQGRGGPPDDGDGGAPEGLRPAQRPRSGDGQVPGRRVRQGGRGRLPPHPRRLRLHQEYEIERLYRDVPLLLIGEGTAEIQKMIIGRRLLEDYRIPG